ncbi:response regulator [Nostoc sp. TCL26-01]|uniref:response regulator n=1 Tax=Nostoc sp. TCL26-01 TaxID=2576904 RepID=UPI0015B7A088|nr:response regulator [Nostoc sp. TCL26-01]QLE57371.1 response regulator [Nostoc sp. TCL26-01]
MTTKRILVVDDEALMQEVVQACLEEIAGWEVITASSGQEALAKAAREQPDAIILDVMMPGMDGIEFMQRLKADSNIQSIPVILLTAKLDFTEPARLRMLGVAGAIAKPFDPILLVEQIAAYLGWTL